jgi:site-specific DNA-methyltransferase (cytosine-N4-specific)
MTVTSELLRIVCEECGEFLEQPTVGRRRRYCSSACRQLNYRRRHADVVRAPGAYCSGEGWALHLGDARRVLELLPRASVQTVVTSPPYYNLRDYRGHVDQLGQEETPAAYVDALVDILDRAARVLRPDGTLWLNLGDTYASRTNAGDSADRTAGRAHHSGVMPSRISTTNTAPLKSLLLIPHRVAIAASEAGWIVRNDVIWHKTNAMPHSVADRLNNRHEHLFLLTRSQRYRFDLDAIKLPAKGRAARNLRRAEYATSVGTDAAARRFGANPGSPLSSTAYETRNPGDVWELATSNGGEDHYAMFPPELPRRCIQASTRPSDIVLDPFAGRSTTGRAALELGRRYIGIDINTEDLDASAQRLREATS